MGNTGLEEIRSISLPVSLAAAAMWEETNKMGASGAAAQKECGVLVLENFSLSRRSKESGRFRREITGDGFFCCSSIKWWACIYSGRRSAFSKWPGQKRR